MTAEEIRVIITAQNEEFNRRIDEVTSELDKMKSTSESAVTSTGNMFRQLAGLLSSLGLAKLIGDCNSAYETQMMNEVKLATIMRQRIGATDDEIESIKRLASAQQEIGVVGDEIQLAGAQQLATFATSTKTIATLIPAMNNLMVQQNGFNTSASSAVSIANMMGKALQGQTSALTRVGISFTEAQEQVLKYGTEAEKAATLAQVITDNVGDMNEALRNTPLGELKALKNDLGDFAEQIGGEFQPAISALLPLFREVFVSARPLILATAEGATKLTQALSLMSPETKRLITLAMAAAVVIPAVTRAQTLLTAAGAGYRALLTILIPKQLTFAAALKATAGWIGVIAGAMALLSMFKDKTDSTADSFEEESEGAKSAAESVDDLGDSLRNVGETSKKTLADIDKINVFGGNSTLGSSIISTEDIENFTAADDIIKDLQENSDVDVGVNFNLDLNSIYNSIKKVIKWLTEDVWNSVCDFWFGVGSDIEKIVTGLFSGDDSAVYQGLSSLNDKFKEFFGDFGEDWSSFWEEVGAGIYDFINGDLMGGLSRINELFKNLFGDLGEDWSNFWTNIGASIYEATHGDEIEMQALQTKYTSLGGDMNAAIVEYLKQGLTSEEAIKSAKSDLLTSSESMWFYENGGIAATLADVEQWRKNLISSGQMYSYTDYSAYTPPSYSAAAQTDAVRGFRELESEVQPFVIEQTTYVQIDGETIGEAATTYASRQEARSNGY